MIQNQSIITVVDNSGAKNAKCIKVLTGFKRRYAYMGDTVVVVINSIKSKKKSTTKVKRGEVIRLVLIRTKFRKSKKDGSSFHFNVNAGVLVNKQNKPIATRVIGPVTKELKTNKLMKIASLSGGFL